MDGPVCDAEVIAALGAGLEGTSGCGLAMPQPRRLLARQLRSETVGATVPVGDEPRPKLPAHLDAQYCRKMSSGVLQTHVQCVDAQRRIVAVGSGRRRRGLEKGDAARAASASAHAKPELSSTSRYVLAGLVAHVQFRARKPNWIDGVHVLSPVDIRQSPADVNYLKWFGP